MADAWDSALNIAYGKTVAATTDSGRGLTTPENLTDGTIAPAIFEEGVFGAGTYYDQWRIDLGASYLISAITIVVIGGAGTPVATGLSIEISESATFAGATPGAMTTSDYGEWSPDVGLTNYGTFLPTASTTGRYIFVRRDWVKVGLGYDPGWEFYEVLARGLSAPKSVGVWTDWDDDGFGTSVTGDGSLARMMPEASAVSDDITSDAIEFSWQRGGTADLAGGVSPGSCTIIVKNATKKYNPDNTASALYGKLRPGRPVWIGVNGDGSVVETAGQTVYGVFAGRIREIAPQPLEQTCEIICDDPLAYYRRMPVRLAGSTARSQAAYRLAIMGVIGEPAGRLSLPAESAMLPLSSLDTTDALASLDELNKATGTRHYAEPSGTRDTWYVYTARDRHYHLGGTPDATLNFGSDRVVSIDGYRVTEESVVNIQKTTIAPVSFPLGAAVVWMHVQVPLTVAGNLIIWAEFADYVAEPSLEVTSTGAAVTSTLTSFGATAKIELYSTGAQIQRLVVVGKLAIREPSVSYVAEDEPSKAAYGSRAGGEITSDLFGGQAEAKGLADHTIWRYAQPLTRPAITLRGAPVATALRELYDMVAVTSTALSVTARRFDIVGISGTWRTATATVGDFEVKWQLSESPLQTSRIFFTIGTSVIDGPDVIGY